MAKMHVTTELIDDFDERHNVVYLTAPEWNGKQWTALANVSGALCIVEVKLTEAKGE